VFCSGQCGYDAKNAVFYGEDIETQTRGALDNLQETFLPRAAAWKMC
jgi:enamine deaminase RidA (YjgF/YER057c/UK114 family)